jgi:hypothetical protein
MKQANTKKGILALLKLVDQRIKSEAILVTLGGTALTLLGDKEYSLDIDLLIFSVKNEEEFYNVYFQCVDELKLIQGEHPPFRKLDMSLLKIDDFFAKAHQFRDVAFKNIKVYIMDLLDIILSKNYRGLPKDRRDILSIMQMHKIKKQALYARYLELFRQQSYDIRPSFEQKYQELIKDFGRLLK